MIESIMKNCLVYVCEFLKLLFRIFAVDVHVIFFHVQYDEFLNERKKMKKLMMIFFLYLVKLLLLRE